MCFKWKYRACMPLTFLGIRSVRPVKECLTLAGVHCIARIWRAFSWLDAEWHAHRHQVLLQLEHCLLKFTKSHPLRSRVPHCLGIAQWSSPFHQSKTTSLSRSSLNEQNWRRSCSRSAMIASPSSSMEQCTAICHMYVSLPHDSRQMHAPDTAQILGSAFMLSVDQKRTSNRSSTRYQRISRTGSSRA